MGTSNRKAESTDAHMPSSVVCSGTPLAGWGNWNIKCTWTGVIRASKGRENGRKGQVIKGLC